MNDYKYSIEPRTMTVDSINATKIFSSTAITYNPILFLDYMGRKASNY